MLLNPISKIIYCTPNSTSDTGGLSELLKRAGLKVEHLAHRELLEVVTCAESCELLIVMKGGKKLSFDLSKPYDIKHILEGSYSDKSLEDMSDATSCWYI